MTLPLLLALAGGVGALGRVELSVRCARRWPGAPWGTRIANLVGTTGLVVLLAADPGPDVSRVLAGGLLGGFTTFSTWMLDAADGPATGRAREVVGPLLPALLLALVALGPT